MDARIDTSDLLSQVTSQVKTTGKDKDPAKLKEKAQEFEAIFIQQMFKEMRKTIPHEGLIETDNASDTYNQLQDMEAARLAARQGGIGLAELMMQQLSKEGQ